MVSPRRGRRGASAGKKRTDKAPEIDAEEQGIDRAKSVKKMRAVVPKRVADTLHEVLRDTKGMKAKARVALGKEIVRRELRQLAETAAEAIAPTRPQPAGVKGRSVTFHLPTERWWTAPASARQAWSDAYNEWAFEDLPSQRRSTQDAIRAFEKWGGSLPDRAAAARLAKRLGASGGPV